MSEFSILLDSVRSAAAGIQATVDGMDSLGVDRIVGPSAQYGHDGLHSAFADFGDRWQIGVSALIGDVDALSDGMRAAVETYAATDSASSQAIQRSGAPIDGGP